MSYEAYSVAVKLSLINHVSSGLLLISKNMKSVHADADKLNEKLKSIGKTMAIGGALFGGGALMAGMLKGPYEEAKKLAQAKADFETLNLSASANSEVYAKAATMSHKILGTTLTDNVKTIHDLHTAFGDLHHAISAADQFSRFSFIARVMNDGKPVEGLVYNAAKALEHRGAKVMGSVSEFNAESDLMERVYLGSRGKVNPTEFFNASQTGKLAYTLMSKEELYGPFAAYMQAKSGHTAGTAAMTFASSLIGGHMTNSAKDFLSDLGLWDEMISPKRIKMIAKLQKTLPLSVRKQMGLLMPTHGGLKSEYIEMATQNQSKFVQEVLVPAIRKRFGMNMTDEQVATMLMSKFNRNTSDFMGEYVVNEMKFKKDEAIFKNSKGIGAAYQHYLKSPEGAELAASAAWKNLLTLIGSVYLPTVVSGLMHLANWLDKAGQFVEKNQGLVKLLVYAFMGLSAVLMAAGMILLIKGVAAAFALVGTSLIGLPASIAGAATSFGILQKAAGAFMAFAAGYQAGTWLNDHVVNPGVQKLTGDKNATLGTWIYDKTHPNDGKNAVAPVATHHSKPIQVHTQIDLDGKRIASVVTKHQTNGVMRLPASTGVNPNVTMPFPSY